jgi:hypothetical protein
MSLFSIIYQRNKWLYWTGCLFFFTAKVCLGLFLFDIKQISGVYIWLAPFQIAMGSGVLLFTMAWLLHVINNKNHRNWVSIIYLFAVLSVFILNAFHAVRGKTFNSLQQTPLDEFVNYLTILFCLIIFINQVIITGMIFLQKKNMHSQHYTWGIRSAMMVFSIFMLISLVIYFAGHKINPSLNVFDVFFGMAWGNQSIYLKISYYLGLHSIQLIPLLSYYLFEKKKQVIVFSFAYITLIILLLFLGIFGKF